MRVLSSILNLFTVTVLAFVLSFLAMLSVRLTGSDIKDFKQRTHPRVLAIAMLFNLLFILAIGLILKFMDHQSMGVLGFSLGGRRILFVIFILFFSIISALLYVRILHSKNIVYASYRSAKSHRSTVWPEIILGFGVLFVAALQEEILFRGYFSYILLPYGFWYGIIISSLVFTMWHFITNKAEFFQTADWLMGGIMLFFIYWISGSIWIAALTHFSRNLTNVLVFDISGSNALLEYKKPIKPSYKSLYTILYSTLVMLSGYVVFDWSTHEQFRAMNMAGMIF